MFVNWPLAGRPSPTKSSFYTLTLFLWQYARTELIKNNQNPQFTKSIEIEYRFEELQKLKFTVYDLDNTTVSLGDDDFLGEIECSLGEVCACMCVLAGCSVKNIRT